MNLLESIIIEPQVTATTSVIWLHGLGASGDDFVDAVPALGLEENHSIRFIFPHAKKMPVTINGGLVMPAWYDIAAIDLGTAQDEAGVKASQQEVIKLIEREKQLGIATNKIFLFGFSQGGAMALYTSLRYPEKLAGVVSLSGYLPLHENLSSERSEANKDLNIFMAHGTMDPIVPLFLGEGSKTILEELGYKPDWHSYPMMHAVCSEELITLGNWLIKHG